MSIKESFIACPIHENDKTLSRDEAREYALTVGWFNVAEKRKVGIFKLVEVMEIEVKPRITPVE